MAECIFCKIISGEIPAAKFLEEDGVVGFLDINPANKGHALVVPKRHAETLIDLSPEEAGELAKAVRRVSEAVLKASGGDGFNVLQNNYPAAGQIIPHAHVHVIPRFKDDGLDLKWKRKEYAEGEMKEFNEKLKNFLKKAPVV